MNIYTTETEPIERPGGWHYARVKIFCNGDQVGEYVRNYSTARDTFFPFVANGREVALYSKDYTCTRLMSLPDCVDIGGEEPRDNGFCPTGYFVPTFMRWNWKIGNEMEPYECNHPNRIDIEEARLQYQDVSEIMFRPFGFVCGCIWGNDTSWKIQHLDLSEADKGVVKRDERYGYIELPERTNLAEAIVVQIEPGFPYVKITTERTYNYLTGVDTAVEDTR